MTIRIIVPLDGSELSEQALPAAERLAKAFDSCELELLYVINPMLIAEQAPPSVVDEELDWANDYVKQHAAALTQGSVKGTGSVLVGPPAQSILERIARSHPDYVVMATHGRSGLGRALLGSVTDMVLRQSPVPVVVVHPAAARALEGDLASKSTAHLIELFARRDLLANRARAVVVERGSQAVPDLLTALSSPDTGIRQSAIRALGEVAAPGSEKRLLACLQDDSLEVRWEAAEALAQFPDRGVPEVLSAIEHEPLDERLALSYVHVLRQAPPPLHELLKPVVTALLSGNARFGAPLAASEALGRLGSYVPT